MKEEKNENQRFKVEVTRFPNNENWNGNPEQISCAYFDSLAEATLLFKKLLKEKFCEQGMKTEVTVYGRENEDDDYDYIESDFCENNYLPEDSIIVYSRRSGNDFEIEKIEYGCGYINYESLPSGKGNRKAEIFENFKELIECHKNESKLNDFLFRAEIFLKVLNQYSEDEFVTNYLALIEPLQIYSSLEDSREFIRFLMKYYPISEIYDLYSFEKDFMQFIWKKWDRKDLMKYMDEDSDFAKYIEEIIDPFELRKVKLEGIMGKNL